MDGLQQNLNERDEWADSIQTIVDELKTEELWEDLTDKEFRITALEESPSHRSTGGEAARVHTAGETEEDHDEMRAKVQELEEIVNELRREPRPRSPQVGRKPISEFKVVQNITLYSRTKLGSGTGTRSSSTPWVKSTVRTNPQSEIL